MIRKSHLLLALALVAAAVAAPIAHSSSTPKVDPLAVGYLIGQGLSPSEVTAWTTGSCSQEVKAASCYAMLRVPREPEVFSLGTALAEYAQQHVAVRREPKVFSLGTALAEHAQKLKQTATPKVDPLAVGYLMGQGLSPSQVKSWTVGACSHRVKDASCYAMFPSQAASTQVVPPSGFQWGDAGIGAGFTLGIILLGGAAAGLFISRRQGGRQAPRTA
jgi:hypothetical protein